MVLLVADAWPPFNATAGDDPEGYFVDIARAVFSEAGYTVDYQNVPWKRAIQGTHDGLFDGAIGASRTDGAGLVFPEEELARNRLAFYTRADDDWCFNGEQSLDGVSLGVIQGYDYRTWLLDYIERYQEEPERIQVMSGENPLEQNLVKLCNQRVDVVVDTDASIRYLAHQSGITDQIRKAGAGEEVAFCYIAFSPNERGRELAGILSDGIRELRRSGRLAEILSSYGLTDWQEQDYRRDCE